MVSARYLKWAKFFLKPLLNNRGSIDFDGTDDRIDLTTVTTPTGNAFSFSCWIYPDIINATKYILNANDATATRTFSFMMTVSGSNGLLQFQRLDTTRTVGKIVRTTTQLTQSAWNHVLITDDGVYTTGSSAKIYINGTEASYGLQQNGTLVEATHSGAWQIGARSQDNAVNWDGKITETAYWNAVLSAEEILNLAKSRVKSLPLQIKRSNLLFYLPFDDQPDGTSFDGDILADLSGGGKTGTGNDGANNTGLTAKAEEILSWPDYLIYIDAQSAGGSVTVTPSALSLTLSQPALTVITDRVIALSALSLTLSQPSLTVITDRVIPLAAQALTLSQPALTVVTNGGVTVNLSVQSLSLSQPSLTVIITNPSVTIQISTQSLTLSLMSLVVIADPWAKRADNTASWVNRVDNSASWSKRADNSSDWEQRF